MTELVLADGDRFEQMERVASLRLTGKSDTAVAKELGLQRKVVIELFAEYRESLSRDGLARDLARDHLNQMVVHYDKLIEESYKLLSSLKSMAFGEKVSAQINATLKNISDYESRRVDALQKAGLLDASDLGDELAEMEEKQQILINILRNDLCVNCRPNVMNKLRRVTGQVEEIKVEQVNDDIEEAEIVEDDE